MSFGFQYTDTSGNVIIDQTYQNMGMRQKNTYSMTAGHILDILFLFQSEMYTFLMFHRLQQVHLE